MTVFRDLSQHLLDIAENSIAAGASLVNIGIEEDTVADRLWITVSDNGQGMDGEMVARVTDPWVTTRTTRKVGLGIPFLKQTAEMCDGSFMIQSQLGLGTTTSAVFRRSHIDRPPLGDLAGTLVCIIVGNPRVDIAYAHRVDQSQSEFRTRELREILGEEVPLSDPEVIGYIRGELTETLRALNSEAAAGM